MKCIMVSGGMDAPVYSAPSSPQLLRGAPDYSTDTVSEFHLVDDISMLMLTWNHKIFIRSTMIDFCNKTLNPARKTFDCILTGHTGNRVTGGWPFLIP